MIQLASLLDRRTTPLTLFFRNDDAGWDMDALDRLLDLFAAVQLPIDLATIPAALDAHSAARINHWRRQHPQVRVHQHGYAHFNHEPDGARKCEFGPARPLERQCADIMIGRERLAALLGETDPIFTPPWNRCAEATVQRLPAMGFRVFSADRPLPSGGTACVSLPVSLDWDRARRAGTLAEALTQLLTRTEAMAGIMLHHATLDDGTRSTLRDFLNQVAAAGHVHCQQMIQISEYSA